jgi:hypothetical protein
MVDSDEPTARELEDAIRRAGQAAVRDYTYWDE